jgi:hypothetical protein
MRRVNPRTLEGEARKAWVADRNCDVDCAVEEGGRLMFEMKVVVEISDTSQDRLGN